MDDSGPDRAAADRLLALISGLCVELRPGQPPPAIVLDSRLERDAELDSLARAELIARIESEFGARLPERLIAQAQTPRDFLDALASGAGREAPPGREPRQAFESGDAAPESVATLVDALRWHAAHQPDRVHLVLLGERGEHRLRYGELMRQASAVAAALQSREIAAGDRVALMLPTCAAFFPCFVGIQLAGAVPVPIYPPPRPSQLEDHLRRHAGILQNAGARLLIASGEVAAPAALLRGLVAGLRGIALADELIACSKSAVELPARADQLALLQYTSGSTGNPKGVMLTHEQLLANIRAMARAAAVGRDDLFVSWLPLYHDMGLICAWLSCLVLAVPFVVMSPLAFLAEPGRWLQAISDWRATLSGAPNFAYELCLKRIGDDELASLDLSRWRIAFNGAEPVGAATMERFAQRFAACGLKPGALAPVYGLAECAVGLTLSAGRGVVIDAVDRRAFSARGEALPAAADDANPLRFVACGRPLPGYEIRVVDAAGTELPERREGRLEFRGPSATAGYWNDAPASARLIRDGWLDSGDRAYIAQGELYLSGRVKDIVIKAGRNIHPQEVEAAVSGIAGVRAGCVAVFGSPDPASGTERLIVAAETRLTDAKALQALREAIQQRVVDLLGMPADQVVLSGTRIVLKTSSGKVRRAASRALFERGLPGSQPRAAWLQWLRLFASGVAPTIRRMTADGCERLAGIRAAAAFLLIASLGWPLLALCPTPSRAWALCHRAARIWLRLAGIEIEVAGETGVPERALLVANHCSYIDGLALLAAFPAPGWRFVAKRELALSFFVRVALRRLGCEFVERSDFQQGVADAQRISALAASGARLAFFPEGTFTRVPGLRPFHLGAFVAAARAGLPVLAVALSGTRDRLRDGHWLPRRGVVRVTAGKPIEAPPLPDEWARAVALRDAARAAILAACGEPDLQR